jgi:hypothetical protein
LHDRLRRGILKNRKESSFSAAKQQRSALVTEGSSLPSDLRKGGLPDEYIRSVAALLGHHWYLQPVYSGQKEVTAGTLTSTAITFVNFKG